MIFITYLSIFLHAIALLLCPVTLAKNYTDHLALLAIRSTITLDPQNVFNSWNASFHFCEWEGVTCGRRHLRVTKLDLGSKGMVGSLSPQIGNLSFLRELKLENNTFKGAIPPQLGNLFRLQKLYLMGNSFEGEVPSSLSNCTRLEYLMLADNKLAGKLPQQLSSLVNLIIISFHYNDFTGGIPSFLANLTSLETILAADNRLSGSIPHALGQLHNLRQISFSNNQLHGIIPPSLYNLTSLTVLSISYNQISGDLPKDIGLQLPNLELFHIAQNKFTGTIPFSFSNCSNLVALSLSTNGFTGKISINFNQMPNLAILGLFENSLGSSQPDDMHFIDSMINCSSLESLLVHDNKLSGVIPSSIGNLSSQVTTLSFATNSIYGTLPSEIGNLEKLEQLLIGCNQFTGIIPHELGNLRNLKYLYLGHNNFTGNFLEFQKFTNLSYLDLSYNNFRGDWTLDTLLSSLTNLETLSLSHCGASVTSSNVKHYVNTHLGTLSLASCSLKVFPVSLRAMIVLNHLDLSSNDIHGHIPGWIGEIGRNQLFVFDLSNNSLTGTIPNVYMNWGNLEGFNVNGNHLEGKVPTSLEKCRNLRIIDLGNNHINDTFPEWLGDLPKLQTLVLRSNNFYGGIVTSSKVKFPFPSLRVLDLSHNGFVGQLPTKYFQNFNAMKNVVKKKTKPEYVLSEYVRSVYVLSDMYHYSVTIALKGNDQYFSKLLVDYTIIDLSHNKFEREIPNIIGDLNSLKVLKLSHNNLIGQIPQALGKISEIESLDLSWNQLTGEIPQSLVGLTFLGFLNLSQNHLVGRIPHGNQFDTFEENSFGGNPKLCGFPLPKNCSEHVQEQFEFEGDGDGDDDEESVFTWKAVMIGYGCGTLLGFVLGYLKLSTGRPKEFTSIIDAVEHMIFKSQNKRRWQENGGRRTVTSKDVGKETDAGVKLLKRERSQHRNRNRWKALMQKLAWLIAVLGPSFGFGGGTAAGARGRC